MEVKNCKKCLKEKRRIYFNKDKSRKDGLSNWCKSCLKFYKETIKDKTKIYNKQYNKLNKDQILIYNKQYRKKNKLKIKQLNKEYNIKNKSKILEHLKNKYKNNITFRLNKIINASINQSFKFNGYKKNSKTEQILGCTFEEFKKYLESKFEPWMTWNNQGIYTGNLNEGWDIDHIIPISSGKNEREIRKLYHYTNLQPLCSKINRDIKRDNLDF